MEQPRSIRLTEALAALWSPEIDYGLLPDLPGDAVLSRARRGEMTLAIPRLLELAVSGRLTVAEAAGATTLIGEHLAKSADDARLARRVEEVLDAWWLETLMRDPGTHVDGFEPEAVLGIVAGYDAPMVRWFEPWLEQLDGPGAAHLGAIVVAGPAGLTPEAWVGCEDQASQLFAWSRSETVVNGIALIGGVHLDDGMLDQVLERLIG